MLHYGLEDPGANGLPRPQPLAPRPGPWAWPWGNLANPGHISYHLQKKQGNLSRYFVNIQGANLVFAHRGEYKIRPYGKQETENRKLYLEFPVAMAQGKHPIPSRTRQLSPAASMILRGQLRGKVERRRSKFPST